jgi:DNA primase
MARIKDSSVEQVKAAADIVAVVSGRTALRKAGGRMVGRCPFHEERTPSFSVSPDKGYYHCFGCGKGGDAIRFVQEAESLDFVGAIEWLADRFSVPLEYEEASPEVEARRQRGKRLQALLAAAAAFYERYLWDSPAGGAARDYLKSRALAEEVCRELGLGLALGGTTLARKAAERGFTEAELAAAGLVNRRGNDFFSGRLMFPLADARGRIVGFQARKLREDDPLRAKYVNSPESDHFRKGSLLYGLHLARTAIAKEGRALVVEGNTDVLALRQAGVASVVASMGTALTEQQVRELARLTRRVYLCFDGDAAGEAATLRGMEIAADAGLDVRVIALPPGFDPADVADGFEERLGTAESYLGYRVRLELERAPDRQEAFVGAREVLARFEDSPERQAALRMIADRLELPKETLGGLGATAQAPSGAAVSPKLLERGERLERDALAGVVAHPELLPILRELGPEHFVVELHRRTCAHLLEPGAADAELVPVLAELDARAASEGITQDTAEQLLLRLRERRLRHELETADDERLPELQQALAKVRTAFRQFA